ncbi:hypothetical protein [Hyalangium sp.]|uniref:hypothetical protein n=1 Tax=Hyalangium sp. TaxID=2028555 RepID=UPI002D3791A6|nr:hypothetical protein [Hyalangium sp.]HYH94641.1 hypothetical protein [Hyalangium sp.]
MSRIIRLSLLAVATTALVACGGGAKLGGGKEGAAKALFEASQPAGKGGNSNGQSLLRALASGADTTGNIEVSVDCAQGGSVKLKLDLTSGTQSGSFKYALEYKGCNEDGVNEFNGTMTMELSLAGTATSLELAMRLKGKIEISGDIDDFIDADVTETVSVAATSATSGSVTVKLNGTIKTSEGSYVYTNESVTINVEGGIPQDDGKS